MHHRKLESQAFVSKGYQNDILGWHQVDNHHSFLLSPGDPNALTSSFERQIQHLSETFTHLFSQGSVQPHAETLGNRVDADKHVQIGQADVDYC